MGEILVADKPTLDSIKNDTTAILAQLSGESSVETQLMMQTLSDIQMTQELNELNAQEERQTIAQNQSELELQLAQMEVGTDE